MLKKTAIITLLHWVIHLGLLTCTMHSYSMLHSLIGQYIPNALKLSNTQEVRAIRQALEDNEQLLCADPTQILSLSPNSKIVKIFPPDQRTGICHTQSFASLLGIEVKELVKRFAITGNTLDLDNIDVAKYCTYVTTPQKGDFIIYLGLPRNTIKFTGDAMLYHTAIYASNGCAISKFRIIPALFKHDLDKLPASYVGEAPDFDASDTRILFFRKRTDIDILEQLTVHFNAATLQKIIRQRQSRYKKNIFDAVAFETTPTPKHIVKQLKKSNQQYRLIEPFALYVGLQSCPGFNIDEKNENGETLLTTAVQANNQKTTELLIQLGININAANNKGLTPLMIGANNNNINIMQILIINGALLNEKNNDGNTALMLLGIRYKAERLLIEAGADTTIQNNSGEIYQSICNNRIDIYNLPKKKKMRMKK